MSSVVRASQLAMVLLLGLSLPAHAQSLDQAAPLSNPEANSDPFSSRGDNNGAIMQLIHRAMRGEGAVDRAGEAAAQRESLNDAANDFFAKRNQIKKTPPAPLTINLPPTAPNQPGSLEPATVLPIGPVTSSTTTPSAVTPSTVTPNPEVTPGTQPTESQPAKP